MKHEKFKLDKILRTFLDIKGYSVKDLSSNDFGRFYKAIKTLLDRTEGDDSIVIDALDWIKVQEWSWTLETLDKKWLDFKKEYSDDKQFKEMEKMLYVD